MIRPPYLKAGDTVTIVSTARKISRAELKPAVDIIESWGLKVKFGKNLFKSDRQFAGTDAERLADIQAALNSNTSAAVFFARGGYGTVRIIDRLDWKRFRKNPKWLIGFSDITVIHSHVHKHAEAESIHAPLVFSLPKSNANCLNVIRDTLFGQSLRYTMSKPSPGAGKLNRPGNARGQLVGGNLSILHNLSGTPSDIETGGKILFLEDLDEYLYHIDRMMMQMKRSGKLASLAGLIVGSMTEMKDNDIPFGKSAEEIIAEAVEEYSYPVFFGFPAGHIPNNYPLIFGREVRLSVGAKLSLSFGS
jgi:muramoyltetrapeptide carboxypeptidase